MDLATYWVLTGSLQVAYWYTENTLETLSLLSAEVGENKKVQKEIIRNRLS